MKWIVHGHPDVERRSSTETDCFVHSPFLVYVASSRVVPSLPSGVMFFLSVCSELFKSLGGYCTFGDPGGLCRVWAGRGAVVVCWVPHFRFLSLVPPKPHWPQSAEPPVQPGWARSPAKETEVGAQRKGARKSELALGSAGPTSPGAREHMRWHQKAPGGGIHPGSRDPWPEASPWRTLAEAQESRDRASPRVAVYFPGAAESEEDLGELLVCSFPLLFFISFSFFWWGEGWRSSGGRSYKVPEVPVSWFPQTQFSAPFPRPPPIFFNGYCSV